MADEQKPIQTTPTILTTPPIIDTGIVSDVPTVSGTERLKILPDVNVLPGVENLIHVEQQPGDQIRIESPIATTDKVVDINRSPVVPSTQSLLQNQPGNEPENVQNPKIIPIEEARRRVLKKNIPGLQMRDVEIMDSGDALGHLEVKTEEWEEEKEREAA